MAASGLGTFAEMRGKTNVNTNRKGIQVATIKNIANAEILFHAYCAAILLHHD
jgi:hypothetical protein